MVDVSTKIVQILLEKIVFVIQLGVLPSELQTLQD